MLKNPQSNPSTLEMRYDWLRQVLKKYEKDPEFSYSLFSFFAKNSNEVPAERILNEIYLHAQLSFEKLVSESDSFDLFLFGCHSLLKELLLPHDWIFDHIYSSSLKERILHKHYKNPFEFLYSQGNPSDTDFFPVQGQNLVEYQNYKTFIVNSQDESDLWPLWCAAYELFIPHVDAQGLQEWLSKAKLIQQKNFTEAEKEFHDRQRAPLTSFLLPGNSSQEVIRPLVSFLTFFEGFFVALPDALETFMKQKLILEKQDLDFFHLVRCCVAFRDFSIESAWNEKTSSPLSDFLGLPHASTKLKKNINELFFSLYEDFLSEINARNKAQTWKDFLTLIQNFKDTKLFSLNLLKKTFLRKLAIPGFWLSFDEIPDFTPSEELVFQNPEEQETLLLTITEHIKIHKVIYGCNWLSFFLPKVFYKDNFTFNALEHFFSTLPEDHKEYTLIYFLVSFTLPHYRHFVLVYRLLSHDYLTNHENRFYPSWVEDLENSCPQLSWKESWCVISAFHQSHDLSRLIFEKTQRFSTSDLALFENWAPAFLWCLSKRQDSFDLNLVSHPHKIWLIKFILSTQEV